VFAGEYTPSECAGRDIYTIDGKEYDECGFCRASCPSRDWFKEPDSGLPLKCDMCEGEDEPLCVKWCLNDVLVYEEREVWVDEDDEKPKPEQLDIGLESLADKYGVQQLLDAVARMSKKE
jgi:benzoyl-CoA reductase subunit BamC